MWRYYGWLLTSELHLLVEVLQNLNQMVWSHEVDDANPKQHPILVDYQQ